LLFFFVDVVVVAVLVAVFGERHANRYNVVPSDWKHFPESREVHPTASIISLRARENAQGHERGGVEMPRRASKGHSSLSLPRQDARRGSRLPDEERACQVAFHSKLPIQKHQCVCRTWTNVDQAFQGSDATKCRLWWTSS
jgi:hypothetical protein